MKTKKVGSISSARKLAMKDMSSEIVSKDSEKHFRYKRVGYSPYKNGEFDVSKAPYGYNVATGYTM